MQPHSDLGDDAQSALRSDQKAGEVVPAGTLAVPSPSSDDCAIGEDRGETHHVVLHSAVLDGGRPTCPGAGHTSDRGVGARIDGEEEPGLSQ